MIIDTYSDHYIKDLAQPALRFSISGGPEWIFIFVNSFMAFIYIIVVSSPVQVYSQNNWWILRLDRQEMTAGDSVYINNL